MTGVARSALALVLAAAAAAAETNCPPAAGPAGGPIRWFPSASLEGSFRSFSGQRTALQQYRMLGEGEADLRFELAAWGRGNSVLLDTTLVNGLGRSLAPFLPLSPVDLGYRQATCYEKRGTLLWRAGWDHGCSHVVHKDTEHPWYETIGPGFETDVYYNRLFAGVGSSLLRRVDVWRACFEQGLRPLPVWYAEAGLYPHDMGGPLSPDALNGGQNWRWDAVGELRFPVCGARRLVLFAGAEARVLADRAGGFSLRGRVETEGLLKVGACGVSVFAGWTPVDEYVRDSREGFTDFGARLFF